MALIALAVILGVGVLLIGLAFRKRVLIYMGGPAGFLLVLWFVLASLRPNPEREFNRIFGSNNRPAVSDIRTIKPTFMDGHFMSFHIAQSNYDSLIRSQFKPNETRSANGGFLRGHALPRGWPEWVENPSEILTKEINDQDIALVYDPKDQRAYVSVQYEQW